jgi:radical SAM superfamily enzyme with C-terminal helix-hairpin-helix motif
MARSDWAALLTEPAQEYTAYTELQRFGLTPYLPQLRKRFHTRAGAYVMRHYPLFPRYLLLKFNEARHPSISLARGVCKTRPVLSDDDGRAWRAPEKVISAIREAEQRGIFDEILHKGDSVTLAYGALAMVRSVLSSETTVGMVELLTPLFGGTRATVNAAKVIHI